MTTGPRLVSIDRSLLPGLIAIFLFGIMTAVFLTVDGTTVLETAFGDQTGFPDTSIVAAIGYALIGAAEHGGVEATENFLVALILIAILLDAALDGALMLAKRDEGGEES